MTRAHVPATTSVASSPSASLPESGFGVLETPDCPLCGCRGVMPKSVADFDPFRVVRCAACHFAYLSPRPTEDALRKIYAQGAYYSSEVGEGYWDYRLQEPALRATFARAIRALSRRGLTGGTLLEVGCGHGFLLDEARGHFALREGTEMAEEAAVAAATRADRVYHGGLEAVPAGRRYELVISSQVVEHVPDPTAWLDGQVRHLREGGTLVVATPHMGGPWQCVLGARWPSFKVPEHLLYFDRRALGDLLQRVGLVDVRRLPWPHAFPLGLVAARLGLRLPARLGRLSLWIPGTTLAMTGRRPTEP